MAPTKLIPTTVCFCGKIIRHDEAEEGSIYCSSACARLDSMSALCAQESFEASAGNRVKQVLRIGRKEALAKSSHYRRMERFGIGPARPGQRTIPQVPAPSKSAQPAIDTVARSIDKKKAVPKVAVARLQPAPRSLRPLLLASGLASSKASASISKATIPAALPAPPMISAEDEDDASDYGEDDDKIPLAENPRIKNDAPLYSHFSDSSFGSSALVNSNSDSTLSSMSSLTPSSSIGSLSESLTGVSLSTAAFAPTLKSQEARLVHNIPCIPLNAKSLKDLSSWTGPDALHKSRTESFDDAPTPKPGLGIMRLDMHFDDSSWRFDSSESALCDLLRDF